MATLLSALETQIRRHVDEASASYWSSAEIVDIINLGIKDLYRGVVDLGQSYFLTNDITNVSQAADATTLTGVPTDVYKIYLIEPRTLTSSGSQGPVYRPLKYNHPLFSLARSEDSQDPDTLTVYYDLIGQGAPIGAPTVQVAPATSSAVNLRFVYVPVLAAVASTGNNPIPGESDNALIAWGIAFARAKEREERSPDPEWLAVYATEKQNLLISLSPRQVQEPQYVEALFQAYWEG